MFSKRLIPDTDIGADVDDRLALSLLLHSSALRPVGVTAVSDDVALRT